MEDQFSIDLSIIIINWNTCDLLAQCLQNLTTHPNSRSCEIIIVDNASQDGSVEMIRQKFPAVKLIVNQQNVGFASANNYAVRLSQGRFLLFLNPDTIVPPMTLDLLAGYAETHPRAGVIGPRLLNPDGTLQRSCWRGFPGLRLAASDALYLWKLKWLPSELMGEYSLKELQTPRDVDHLLGASLMVRRATWMEVGPYDENYFLFFEETDWCLRAQAMGWEVKYYPQASIVHYGQRSARQIPQESLLRYYQSYYYFCKHTRHYGTVQLLLLKLLFSIGAIIRILLWSWRHMSTSNRDERDLSERMRLGYAKVITAIPSIA